MVSYKSGPIQPEIGSMPSKRHAVLRTAAFYSDKMTSVSLDLSHAGRLLDPVGRELDRNRNRSVACLSLRLLLRLVGRRGHAS